MARRNSEDPSLHEEEVEDVKTVLRLLPLVLCLSVAINGLPFTPISIFITDPINLGAFLSSGLQFFLIPILLIPFYQFIIRPCFCSYRISMLQCIGAGLFVYIVCYMLLVASEIYGVIVSEDSRRYLSCTALADNATHPDSHLRWYWKLGPGVLYSVGYTISAILQLEFVIAQSPDKMKGLVIGVLMSSTGIVGFVYLFLHGLCYDLVSSVVYFVLFVVFLVLSKRYTLRERNREINIQAIVEEHYERYMDQEEEYMRENPQYFESLSSDSYSDTDSD